MIGKTGVNSGGNPTGIPMAMNKGVNPSLFYDYSKLNSGIVAYIKDMEFNLVGKGVIANGSGADVYFGEDTYTCYNPLFINHPRSWTCVTVNYKAIPRFNKIKVDLTLESGDLKYLFWRWGEDSNMRNTEIDIKIHGNVSNLFLLLSMCKYFHGKILLDVNPEEFGGAFNYLSEYSEVGTTVDYTTKCSKIDQIIATKGGGKVYKGTLVA